MKLLIMFRLFTPYMLEALNVKYSSYSLRFHDKRDAEDAMDALDGRQYDGRELKVSLDAGRPQR